MTNIVNTPPAGNDSGSGVGIILGVLVALIIVVLFFVYGLPALRQGASPDNSSGAIDVNVKLPDNSGTPTPNPTDSDTPDL